jgi:hypothetical protein
MEHQRFRHAEAQPEGIDTGPAYMGPALFYTGTNAPYTGPFLFSTEREVYTRYKGNGNTESISTINLNTFANPLRAIRAAAGANIDRYLKQEPRWGVFLLHRIGRHEWLPEPDASGLTTMLGNFFSGFISGSQRIGKTQRYAEAFAPFDPKKRYKQVLVLCPEGESPAQRAAIWRISSATSPLTRRS